MELSSPFPEPFDHLLFSSFESELAHRGYMSWLSFYEKRSRLVMFPASDGTCIKSKTPTSQSQVFAALLQRKTSTVTLLSSFRLL